MILNGFRKGVVRVLKVFCTLPGNERCVEWTYEKIICITISNTQSANVYVRKCKFMETIILLSGDEYSSVQYVSSSYILHSLVSFHYSSLSSSSSSLKVLRIFIRHSTQPVSHQLWNALSDGLHVSTPYRPRTNTMEWVMRWAMIVPFPVRSHSHCMLLLC